MLTTFSLGYASQAQTTKGTVVLNGSLGHTQYKSSTDHKFDKTPFEGFEPHRSKQSSFTLSPSIGYFIKDNFEVGVSVFSSHSKSESIDHSGTYDNGIVTLTTQHASISKTKDKGFNMYARQYKFLTEKLAIYGTLSTGLSKLDSNRANTHTDTTNRVFEYDNQHNTFSVALSPGITFFASRKIGLGANLGALMYRRYKSEETSISKDSSQPQPSVQVSPLYTSNSLSFGFSSMYLNFGLTYFIGK